MLGAMGVFLPAAPGPTAEELAFYSALADRAAVAMINARLLVEADESSALRERSRLARELHDSVSQALFSMTLDARTAQLAMESAEIAGHTPPPDSIAPLRGLTQRAG